jgi:solute carrier family 25 S-adenosylmethionine transporter 26
MSSSSDALSLQPPLAATFAALPPPSFLTSLLAGGVAGTTVDVALFPIDTLKTRLQAPGGFWKAGGLRGIYRGIGAAAAGSAPGAALFFATYETTKARLTRLNREHDLPVSEATVHMAAASLGEVAACLVRVPTEVIKAKMQTSATKLSLGNTVRATLRERYGTGLLTNLTGGLYRGYGMTLFREIPFCMIQFPLYEHAKKTWAEGQGCPTTPLQAATCGSASGAVAGAVTTPLDVLKTRLMLGADHEGIPYKNVRDVWQRTLATEGRSALWHGVQPRVFWISLGGFLFFGAYESAKSVVQPVCG